MRSNKSANDETKLQEVGEHLTEAARAAKDATRAGIEHLKQGAADYYDRGKDRLESLEASLRKKVSAEPLKSVLIAAAVGLVFGFFWKRR
jgi:ElaB/YqjD/DUF883 family membrane-anchored ribosome-binding protein